VHDRAAAAARFDDADGAQVDEEAIRGSVVADRAPS